MPEEALHRTIHPEVKVIDEAKGIMEYVASDETIDSHSEIVLAQGWKFNRFRNNAPFLNSHSSYSIDDVLGKVISAEVINGKLIERVQWAIDEDINNEIAKLGFKMTQAGYLKAVSVGFFATKQAWRGSDEWSSAVEMAKLSVGDSTKVRRIFMEQEQIELSAVVIGSNPNALAKAFGDGAITEEQLSKVGFGGDDEFDFLTKAATAVESPECSEAFRAMIGIEMGNIYKRRGNKQSLKTNPTPPDTSAQKRAAADEIQRHAEANDAFLKKLDNYARK